MIAKIESYDYIYPIDNVLTMSIGNASFAFVRQKSLADLVSIRHSEWQKNSYKQQMYYIGEQTDNANNIMS